MSISGENIRNIAVIGHAGEGKTTLCEAMLFCAGAIDRMGRTDDGTTVTDFDEAEKARKSSVYLSCACLNSICSIFPVSTISKENAARAYRRRAARCSSSARAATCP